MLLYYMKGRLVFVLLPIFLLSFSQAFLDGRNGKSNAMKFELIHRHAHPELNPKPKTHLDRLKDLLHNDMNRQKMISYKRRLSSPSPRREAWKTQTRTSIEMGIHSGRDYGIGQYLATFKVGTPSQKFTLVVDTGSELTWMKCRYRCGSKCAGGHGGRMDRRRAFLADQSSSFKTVPCISWMCKIELMNLFSLTTCPTPLTPCAYDYRYLDGSAALGFFANETVSVDLTNGRKARLHDVLIGCSESSRGGSFGNADGVLGLANGKYTFAAKAMERFGRKFSYCLVDHLSHKNVSNYLLFGITRSNNPPSLLGKIRHTKLELSLIRPFYAVNVIAITIGGRLLDIPSSTWDATQGGGTILDSGTSLTFLTVPAYRPVMAAFEAAVSKRYQRVKLDGVPMEYCFNSTGFDKAVVPKLVVHFADGARFEPHLKSYVIDAADEVKCLGFVAASWPGTSVIGNIMQQNYLWEFDISGGKLGFAPSTCT